MCGILGSIDSSGQISRDSFEDALSKLQHRGPDDRGYEVYNIINNNELILGHTRLSIIDLSDAGHQPMSTSDGRLTITFNGEFYNYKEIREELKKKAYVFTTNTDTEVLLNAYHYWGLDCLERVIGMFAFSVFDRKYNKLVLARDAFGIKPLFYATCNHRLIFASEIAPINALLKDKPKLDFQAAYDYLVHASYDNSERTFFDGINNLRPASYIEYDLCTNTLSEPKRWWSPSINDGKDITFDEAAETVKALFLKNLRLHLRSDVPIGVTLSGGVDSSAIVCGMRYIDPSLPISTFSYIAMGSEKSEEKWVDIVNDHVGAVAHKITATPQELLADLEMLIKAQGEPFGSSSIYAQYRVVKEAKREGIKVTLDGQGADELLAGYMGYPGERIRSILEERKPIEAIRFLNNWSKYPGRGLISGLLYFGKNILPDALFRLARRIMGRSFAPKWLNMAFFKAQGVMAYEYRMLPLPENKGRRVIERLKLSLTDRGLSPLLRHGDRNSMHFSIEGRVPFLTVELANFLYSLPEDYLISMTGETKSVFKKAMEGILPPEIIARKDKIGFDADSSDWKQIYIEKITEISKDTNVDYMFNYKQVINLTEPQLWRVLNFLIFAKQVFN